MSAFPTSIKSFTTKNTNDTIQASHINDLQDETVAIETAALTVNNWTPVLRFGGATTGITYSAQTGTVISIGKLSFVYFSITLTSKGSATGSATITGLTVNASGNPPGMLDFAGGGASLSTPYLAVTTSTLIPLQVSAGTRVQLTDANFTGTDTLRGAIVFTT